MHPNRTPLFLLALTAAVLGGSHATAQNLFANPGFEAGNTGFRSDYNYSSGSNCCEGQYTVRAVPSTFNGAFVNPPPSSAGSKNMMVINGSTKPAQRIWYQNIAVAAGKTYNLQMAACTAVAGGPAILQWQVDGKLIGSSITLPNVTRKWVPVLASFRPATSGTVEIAVRNLNISRFPNDFYIDDMWLAGCTNKASRAGYGTGSPGRLGVPTLTASADPVSGTTITLRGSSSSGLTSSQGLLTIGVNKVAVPLLGGTLLTTLDLLVAVPVPSTGMTLPLSVPPAPIACGVSVYFQLLQIDAAASQGVSFTPGLGLTIGN